MWNKSQISQRFGIEDSQWGYLKALSTLLQVIKLHAF